MIQNFAKKKKIDFPEIFLNSSTKGSLSEEASIHTVRMRVIKKLRRKHMIGMAEGWKCIQNLRLSRES